MATVSVRDKAGNVEEVTAQRFWAWRKAKGCRAALLLSDTMIIDTLRLFNKLPASAHEARLLLRVEPPLAAAQELKGCDPWKEA